MKRYSILMIMAVFLCGCGDARKVAQASRDAAEVGRAIQMVGDDVTAPLGARVVALSGPAVRYLAPLEQVEATATAEQILADPAGTAEAHAQVAQMASDEAKKQEDAQGIWETVKGLGTSLLGALGLGGTAALFIRKAGKWKAAAQSAIKYGVRVADIVRGMDRSAYEYEVETEKAKAMLQQKESGVHSLIVKLLEDAKLEEIAKNGPQR